MQPYDLLMIAVLVGATLFGAMKGLAWQMASLGSIVLSYFVSLKFSSVVAPMIHAEAPWNRFISMLILYILTSFAVWLAFRIVAGAIDRVKLREFDRQVGALFGAFKGVLLCLAITFFAVTLSAKSRDSVLASKSGTYISQLLAKSDGAIPAELHDVLDPYLDRLERGLNPDEPLPVARGSNGSSGWGGSDAGGASTGWGGLRQEFDNTVKQTVDRTVSDFGQGLQRRAQGVQQEFQDRYQGAQDELQGRYNDATENVRGQYNRAESELRDRYRESADEAEDRWYRSTRRPER